MDQKDKIDLSSVNKTKKQLKLPKLANPFKKNTAGPGRDAQGKFASGRGGLKGKSNWMNKKAMLVAVLLVATIGGFYVYKSSASSYTFKQNYSQLQGGAGVVKKGDGTAYVNLRHYSEEIRTAPGYLPKSDKVCTYFTLLGDGIPPQNQKATVTITAYLELASAKLSSEQRFLSTGKYNLCVKTHSRSDVRSVTVQVNGFPEDSGIGVYTIYGKPGARSADASCKISTAQATNGSYTATWTSGGIDTSATEEPVTMRLKNSATGTETPDLPLSGTRALSPKAGANNVYTMTLYEGTEATDLTCSTNINLSPTTPPPATTPSCRLSIAKNGTSYTASWISSGIPAGSNWGSALSRPGGNTAFGATTGSATIVPPTGTTTYTLVIYDKNISSSGAMNSWKATCATSVTK